MLGVEEEFHVVDLQTRRSAPEVDALLSQLDGDEFAPELQRSLVETNTPVCATLDELRERFGETVTGIVAEVTDDKALPKQRRKALQVEHAPHKSPGAALVKLADKICNLRDIANSPPADWSLQRRREYFDWAKQVIDGLPPVNAPLLALFEQAYARRP